MRTSSDSLWQALDRFIAPEVWAAGGDRLREARLVTFVTALGVPIGLVLAVARYVQGHLDLMVAALVFVLASGLGVLVAKRTQRYKLVSLCVLTVSLLAATRAAILYGGFGSTSIHILVQVPGLGFLLAQRRGGLLMMGLTAGALGAIAIWSPDGAATQAHVPVLGVSLMMGALASFGFVYMSSQALHRATVANRRLEAGNAALREARRAAEEALGVRSAFLATMSHEIRTPMNGVIGMTSLLRHTSLTDEQQEFVDTIRLSGDALLTIINDILDFSKIESEQLELEEQPFAVRQCVEEALDLLALAGYDKGLELAYRMAPDVPEHVVGDVTRLRQVLVNLLSNAIKFTEQGRVTVEVETADTSTADALVLAFAVADTGIGIPVDRMDRLFEPFRQVDASTTRQHGGTGLGLAISRRLCEAMGGTITVTSEVGQGSVFRSTVRVARAEVAAPRLDGVDGLRIMLVEPRAFSREALAETLAQQGMHVTAYAAWPAELPTPRPAWVVMAPASGASLATAVAKLRQRWPSGPVVALVPPGRHTAVPTVQTMPLPVKPLRLAQLLAQVDRSPHREAGEITEDLPDLAEAYPLRVLLVEDNPVNQKVGSQLMQRVGYHPDLASDGQEAVDAMQRQDYDVVLMDMHMPTMDGLTATRHIRAQERPGQRLPYIIGMTANVLPEDQQRCLESGMDDFVAKPVRPEALYEALRRAAQARPTSVS